MEAGVRDDAGDAETGRGLEVASGFRYHQRDRGLFVEATARSLVSHEDESYREWALGGTLRLDPGPDYEGLAIQINSSRGAAASTVQRLWSDPGAVTYYPEMAQGRHEAEVGYGFRALRGGAMVIPFSGFAYSPSGPTASGWGAGVRLGSRWILSLQADRNRYGFREPWYGVVLRGHLLPEFRIGRAPGRGEEVGGARSGRARAGGFPIPKRSPGEARQNAGRAPIGDTVPDGRRRGVGAAQ